MLSVPINDQGILYDGSEIAKTRKRFHDYRFLSLSPTPDGICLFDCFFLFEISLIKRARSKRKKLDKERLLIYTTCKTKDII